MAIIAAFCAKFVLFPMRKRWIGSQTAEADKAASALPAGAHTLLSEQAGE
jgi:hypothetical protein